MKGVQLNRSIHKAPPHTEVLEEHEVEVEPPLVVPGEALVAVLLFAAAHLPLQTEGQAAPETADERNDASKAAARAEVVRQVWAGQLRLVVPAAQDQVSFVADEGVILMAVASSSRAVFRRQHVLFPGLPRPVHREEQLNEIPNEEHHQKPRVLVIIVVLASVSGRDEAEECDVRVLIQEVESYSLQGSTQAEHEGVFRNYPSIPQILLIMRCSAAINPRSPVLQVIHDFWIPWIWAVSETSHYITIID
mmetsp:Transcript_1342/g.3275  ORF Transcript_1342/g.3275 Transcript_1342/m.3275 type:complete len:249 (+) Transcript_1342:438-1184(+)|eukprot:CAMPEP_0170585162 /NCGR_PEP_ID=MMETSP0224-20130122/9066_1 /TAXON_ID=285029 /ORGANISM="Togula jolla, Strain CCCM 725" /LENGTH=248 /DNA_ID=CAMNT_0010908627 /DNA_START=413 /DNA_END=1159 /DNA_ORIENTATION=-